MNIGADSSRAFAPAYLSKMLNQILAPVTRHLHVDQVQARGVAASRGFRKFVGEEEDIDSHGVTIRLSLDRQAYESICEKKCFGDEEYVVPDEAEAWLCKHVTGGITRDELDR